MCSGEAQPPALRECNLPSGHPRHPTYLDLSKEMASSLDPLLVSSIAATSKQEPLQLEELEAKEQGLWGGALRGPRAALGLFHLLSGEGEGEK